MSEQFVKGDNLGLGLAAFRLGDHGIIFSSSMVDSPNVTGGQILDEAHEYGRYLGEMLAASHFSVVDKQAWASLISGMTPDQLKKLESILKSDIQAQSAEELDGLLISLRAAQHKHDLSLSALKQKTESALDDFEKNLQNPG